LLELEVEEVEEIIHLPKQEVQEVLEVGVWRDLVLPHLPLAAVPEQHRMQEDQAELEEKMLE
jgi:hypothetical protein